MKTPPIDLDDEQLRAFGQEVLELCLAHWQRVPNGKVWEPPDAKALDRVLRKAMPEQPGDRGAILAQLRNTVFTAQAHQAHPRFLAFVPGPGNFVSALGDLIASVHNPFAGNWLAGAGAQTVERTVIEWLAKEAGLPYGAGGIFLSGGSLSNVTAIIAAREWKFSAGKWGQGAIYLSEQTHVSVRRMLRFLGFDNRQVRVVPSDAGFRLPIEGLRKKMDDDAREGLIPFCVVSNAGTTNTGAVDPMTEISALCKERRAWMHVDGAYGGLAVLCEEGKAALSGMELADSITLDPHKWLFQPYASSCLLARDPRTLANAFRTSADYLQDAEGDWNLFDYGPELTRPFRALKVWLSLEVFGAAAFREAIAHGFELARFAESKIAETADWRVVTPASMGIVTFRHEPEGMKPAQMDEHNTSIAGQCLRQGFAFVVTTRVRGQVALRLCTINPRTTKDDISATMQHLGQLAGSIES
jgi:glutamate/tyrosine decarboxylase-like PLP-dependent enzyme